jgi:Double zinc ribbon
MLPLAYFGIESSGLTLVIDLLILFVVVLYLSLIYWTYTDARRRITDPMLVGCATAASLFPFVGTIIYLVLRPPEYLDDVRERELETQAIEARLDDLDRGLCPYCDYKVERDFVVCPACLRRLKERCGGCQRPLERDWAICPYCETEVPGAVPTRRRRRRRETDQEPLLIESPSPRERRRGTDRDSLLLDSPSGRERTRPFEGEPASEEDASTIPQRAVTPAGRAAREGAATRPVAASEPVSPPSRSAPRAARGDGHSELSP